MKKGFSTYILPLAAAVILSACQRGVTYQATPYQSKSSVELNQIVNTLNHAVQSGRGLRGASTLRLAGNYGDYDLFGMQPYQNQYFPSGRGREGREAVITSCLSLLGVMNTTTTSQVFMSALIKCTNVVASQQNPAYAMTYNNLGNADRSKYWYTGAYAMPGVGYQDFVNHSYNYQGQYHQWASYGDLAR